MTIGEKILESVQEDVGTLLNEYASDIDTAYKRMGSGASLPVTLSVKFSPADQGIEYKLKISFPSGAKVEAEVTKVVDENQMDIEFPEE